MPDAETSQSDADKRVESPAPFSSQAGLASFITRPRPAAGSTLIG